jgi:hypothetical protein
MAQSTTPGSSIELDFSKPRDPTGGENLGADAGLPGVEETLGPPPVESTLGPRPADPADNTPMEASPGFLERFEAGTRTGRIMKAFGDAAGTAFGTAPVGLSPEQDRWLRDIGVFGDDARGTASPIRMATEAMVRPVAVAVDGAMRSLAALGAGASAAIVQDWWKEMNQPGANEAERELNNFQQALPFLAHQVTPFTRVERGPNGEIHEPTVANALPSPKDFTDATTALVGTDDPAIKQKLLTLYHEKGLHPAELATDARTDPLLAQDLASDATTLPQKYQPGRYGAGNRLFTKGVADEARARLASKSTTFGAGIDPNDFADLVRIAGYHIEAGARTFAQFSAKMIGEFGDKIEPHLAALFKAANGAQDHPEGLGSLAERGGWHGGGEPPRLPPRGGEVAPYEEPPERGPGKPSFEDAQKRILAKISVGEKDYRRPMSWSRFYTNMVDKLYPISEAVEEATEGKPVAASDDPYKLSRLIAGQAGKADHFLNTATFDFDTYQNNGKSLKAVLAPIKKDLNPFRAFTVALRTLELDKRGIASGFDVEDARVVVEEGREKFGPVMGELVDYQNRLAAYLRDSGVLSKRGYAAMLEANKTYVPFYRIMDDSIGHTGSTGKSLQARNPIQTIEGSDRIVKDPLESIVRNTYLYVSLAEKNAVAVKMTDMLINAAKGREYESPLIPVGERKPGMTEVEDPSEIHRSPTTQLEHYPTEKQAALPGPPQEITALPAITNPRLEGAITKFLNDHGVDADPDLVAMVRTAAEKAEGDEITAMRDGKATKYRVDPELARAFKGLDIQSAGLLARVMGKFGSTVRAGSVLTLEFALRHIFRDATYAYITGDSFNPLVTVSDMVKGTLGQIFHDKDFNNWQKSGGSNNSLVALDRRYVQKNLEKLTQETGLGSRSWNVITHPIRSTLNALRMVTEFAENASHLGAFKREMRKAEAGMTGGTNLPAIQGEAASTPSKADIQHAGFVSRDRAVDSARMGAQTRAWNLMTAFANITLQDTDRMIRAFIAKPFSTLTKITGSIVVPSILLWEHNHTDERYRNLPDWDKDLFYHYVTAKHIFRVPKPFGIGTLFGSGTERIMDHFQDDVPASKAFSHFFRSVKDVMTPGFVPSALVPIIDQFADRSLFTGAPLIPDRLEKQLPEYQQNPYTSELAKFIGHKFAAFPGLKEKSLDQQDTMMGGAARALSSPALIEHYIQSWSGQAGKYTLDGMDYILRKSGALPDPTMPEISLADIPFIKAFVSRYPSASAQNIQDFYDRFERQQIIYNTIKAKEQEGDITAVRRELGFDEGAMVDLSRIAQSMAAQTKAIRLVYGDTKATPSDMRQSIDALYDGLSKTADAGNALFAKIDRVVAAKQNR